MKNNNSVIIVAAGSGSRMSSKVKKQFLELRGKPILSYSLEFFDKCNYFSEIILVVSREDLKYCENLVCGYDKVIKIVPGGDTRQESVFNGLEYVNKAVDVVVVHDAARPFVNFLDLEKLLEVVDTYGSSAFGVLVKDTIKLKNNDMEITETLNRDELVAIQTPQAFLYDKLFRAHKYARECGYSSTDDTALLENIGVKTKIVLGSYYNIKVTTDEDLLIADAISRLI